MDRLVTDGWATGSNCSLSIVFSNTNWSKVIRFVTPNSNCLQLVTETENSPK
uniref:Uncharacterized protein n=1 Tax=Oryza brachyantha TaxID=4533 RepID=J3N8L6_ORYBR